MNNTVPRGLKYSFIFHFIADLIFAIPLFFFPEEFLQLFNWQTIDPISTRIVAAALFGIGIKSLTGRNESIPVYKSMINLKLIWSFFASLALVYSTLAKEFTNQSIGWSLAIIFILFHFLWWYWKIQLKKIAN